MSARAAAATTALPPVTALGDPAAEAAIGAACRILHLPTIAAQTNPIAAAAVRERLSHKAFLAEVLTAECDDRDARRRIRRVLEAKFPRNKRLEDLDLTGLTGLPPATLAHLAGGTWIDAGEPVVLLGDSGTGKTHLLIGIGTAAAEAGRRVRYTTTAALVNELVEAADDKQLSRVVARYARLDLLCLDEVGYVHLDPRKLPSHAPPTRPSASGDAPSPTRASPRPSSTDSPSTPTSSKPAPTPTDYAPPAPPRPTSRNRKQPHREHRREYRYRPDRPRTTSKPRPGHPPMRALALHHDDPHRDQPTRSTTTVLQHPLPRRRTPPTQPLTAAGYSP